MKLEYKYPILWLLLSFSIGYPNWAAADCELPAGSGREEVCTYCLACHSLAIVTQQRLSERVWDDVLVWMVEEQAMPMIPAKERDLILHYLVNWFGVDALR